MVDDTRLDVAESRTVPWERYATAAALPATFALFLAVALAFTFAGRINSDEGWYLLAARYVYQGEVLYRDFPYFQSPLLPYVFGAPQAIFGSSLTVGRLTALAMACCSAALVIYIAHSLSGRWAAAIAVVILITEPYFMLASTTARSEAASIPLILLALALMLRFPTGFAGFIAAPLVLVLASGVRLTFLPVAVLALAYTYWRAQPTRAQLIAGVVLFMTAVGAIFGPFLIADDRATIFDVWTSQAARQHQFSDAPIPLKRSYTDRVLGVTAQWPHQAVVLVPTLAMVAFLLARLRDGWRPARPSFLSERLSLYGLIIAFALAAWAPTLSLLTQEARYFAPSFALLAILAADVTVQSWRATFGETGRNVFALLTPLLIVFVALPVGFYNIIYGVDLGDPELAQVNNAGAYIRSLTATDAQIIVLDPTIAVAADREPPRELTMGFFSYWPLMSDDELDAYTLVNRPRLDALLLSRETALIAVTSFDLNRIGRPPNAPPPIAADPLPFRVFPSAQQQFEIVNQIERYGPEETTLWILRRRR